MATFVSAAVISLPGNTIVLNAPPLAATSWDAMHAGNNAMSNRPPNSAGI